MKYPLQGLRWGSGTTDPFPPTPSFLAPVENPIELVATRDLFCIILFFFDFNHFGRYCQSPALLVWIG